jgi:lauroyl/myristoyl acyltransferase
MDSGERFADYLSSLLPRRIGIREFRRDMARQLRANDRFIKRMVNGRLPPPRGRPDETLQQALQPLVHGRRSAAFVCPHWGDYISTFRAVAHALPETSRFITLRGNRWNEQEDLLWAALCRERTIVVHRTSEKGGLAPILREMRAGSHLFALFDLFSDFGETQQVEFFGAGLRMTRGWAKLCHLGQSVVVQLAPVSLQRESVQIFDVLDSRMFDGRDDFVRSCMRSAGRSLRELVAENPAYWFMWEHWDKYTAHG